MSTFDYRTLGRSGLVVSPFTLGTMTFGTARWGSDEDGSRGVFDAFIEAGGNAFDTADVYAGGASEELLGRLIAERGIRDEVVIATKAGFATGSNVLGGGSSARHLMRSLDASLQRLGMDHVDMYWLHVWDGVTPAEELVETMSTLVRSGRTRYWGISDAPAWFVATAVAVARERGLPGPVAMQYFYSLASRDVEHEHVPLALEAGLGFVPWSPLAYGLLTGKYDRSSSAEASGLPNQRSSGDEPRSDRLQGPNPFGSSLFTERNFSIVDEVVAVAKEVDASPAQVALRWLTDRPGVTTILMGASRAQQVQDNMESLTLALPDSLRDRLDAVSAPHYGDLWGLFTEQLQRHAVFGGKSVLRR